MLTVARLRRSPRQFHNFTGLRVEQFDELLRALEPHYAAQEQARKSRPDRQRAIGAGRPFSLALPERLLMTLMYLRLYVTESLLGYLFDVDPSSINRERNLRMVPALCAVLPLPAREEMGLIGPPPAGPRLRTLPQLLERFPDLGEVLIDATEQSCPRPKDAQQQRHRYSGKKKRHTLKTQVLTTREGVVLHASAHVPGSMHDLPLLRFTGVLHRLRSGMQVRVDKGYEGINSAHPDLRIEKPTRARRNHPLTEEQRAENRVQARLRMAVEHALARLEQFRILAGTYRGRNRLYDTCFGLICGLNNFRLLGRLAW